jgi:large subunit ribosomal protein L3
MIGMMGKKVGMTTFHMEDGTAIPVTLIEAGPCYVTQIKTTEKDGYDSVQVGFGEIRSKLVNKPRKGQFKKAGTSNLRHLCEFKDMKIEELALGQEINAGMFEPGDLLQVSGVSKGRGFAGVMKRYNFHGFMASHGVHESFRGAGSIGASSDPSRVWPGKRMPGHMGHARVTVPNSEVIHVDAENNHIFVKGSIPGPNSGLVEIRK